MYPVFLGVFLQLNYFVLTRKRISEHRRPPRPVTPFLLNYKEMNRDLQHNLRHSFFADVLSTDCSSAASATFPSTEIAPQYICKCHRYASLQIAQRRTEHGCCIYLAAALFATSLSKYLEENSMLAIYEESSKCTNKSWHYCTALALLFLISCYLHLI